MKMPIQTKQKANKSYQTISGNILMLLIHQKQRKVWPTMLYLCFVERTSVVDLLRIAEHILGRPAMSQQRVGIQAATGVYRRKPVFFKMKQYRKMLPNGASEMV
jgi:hypothetical protein